MSHSEGQRRRYQDIVQREAAAENARKQWRDPKYRAKMCVSATVRNKRMWENPGYRKQMSEIARKAMRKRREEPGYMQGANNPRWKGGVSGAMGEGWKEARKAVWKRDKTCCACGGLPSPKRRLDVHHVISRRDGGTNDLNNLLGLHHGCHMKVEAGTLTKFRPELCEVLIMPTGRKFRILSTSYSILKPGDIGTLMKIKHFEDHPEIIYMYLLDFGVKKGAWHFAPTEVEEIIEK